MNGASLLFCNGCCCGHEEQGNPALPKAGLQAAWAAAGLETSVRLRFVDCLGPCERPNVAVVKLPGEAIWLADLTAADYDILTTWAAAHAASDAPASVPPLPAVLLARRIPPRSAV